MTVFNRFARRSPGPRRAGAPHVPPWDVYERAAKPLVDTVFERGSAATHQWAEGRLISGQRDARDVGDCPNFVGFPTHNPDQGVVRAERPKGATSALRGQRGLQGLQGARMQNQTHDATKDEPD